MPVVRIRALPQREGIELDAALSTVTRRLSSLLGEDERGTWATWETIEPGRYAEGGEAPAVQPSATHPPLVTVSGFEGRAPDVIERMLACVADALVETLRLDAGNVFVAYEELVSGRLFTGGAIARTDG